MALKQCVKFVVLQSKTRMLAINVSIPNLTVTCLEQV